MITVAAFMFAGCNLQERYRYSGDLEIGEIVEGVLETETPDTFFLDLENDTYLFGVVDQVSVDVVVTLYDPEGNSVGLANGPAEGPEMFYFETREEGRYKLEVAPSEDKSGRYTVQLKVVEHIAADPEKRADQLFLPFSGDSVPGGVAGVIRDGELLFARAYGMADLTYQIPFTVSTPSNIGSVSKQFTAFAILLLEQQGSLSLEDDVRKHIPELPAFDRVITVRNLLDHTNGLREVYDLMPMTGWKAEDVLRREEIIRMVQRQQELQAVPGEEFNYNNTAYILLAEIVERITEKDFPGWMKENVFGPLGMDSTTVRKDPATIIPAAARGYIVSRDGYGEAGDLYASYGAGAIYTTVEDFAGWLNNFSDPEVGSGELIRRLVTPGTLNNGDTMTYAMGINVGAYKGLKFYSHSGADNAHRATLLYFPEIDAGVAVMSNNGSFASDHAARSLADVFFSDDLEQEKKNNKKKKKEDPGRVEVPDHLLRAYEGKYKAASIGIIMQYTFREGKLIFSAEGQPDLELVPRSESVFDYQGVEATVRFNLDSRGKVVDAVHTQAGTMYHLVPMETHEYSADELKSFEGRYYSEELGTFYTLEVKNGTLTLLIRNTEDIELKPMDTDSFSGDAFFISEVNFLRDTGGIITGFMVSNGRTRGIWFGRI